MVRIVRAVVGITNNIGVTPRVSSDRVRAEIEEAFKREAEVDARHIGVVVSDHTAKLYGHVHSLDEASRVREEREAPHPSRIDSGSAGAGRRAGYAHRPASP
jgi:osmotically-inducible protein OsmY